MKPKGPESVGDILAKLAKTSELGKNLEHAQIWDRWAEVAGPKLADHGRPKAIKDKTLYIEADTPVWMHKFAYHKWDILKRIHHMLCADLIADIFILLRADEEDENPGQSQDSV